MNFHVKPVASLEGWKSCLLTVVVAAVVLFIRKTDSFLNPQFWAEDGTIFFLQQYENGASVIFQPYAGYLHLVPRLVALFADTFFPYSEAPLIYNFSSLLLTLFVVANVFSPRFKVKPKPLVALAIVLVPLYSNEVFLNITNIQWILSFLLIILLLKQKPDSSYGNVAGQFIYDLLLLAFCGLTGPFSIFFMPFFIWRGYRDRDLYSTSLLLTALTTALVQMLFIISASGQTESSQASLTLELCSLILGIKVFGTLFLGKVAAYQVNHYILSVLYLSLVLLLAKVSASDDQLIRLCLGLHLVMIMAVFYRLGGDLAVLVPEGNGARYFYIPHVLLTWCLIALLNRSAAWEKILVGVALTLVLISALTSSFRSPALIDYDWRSYSSMIGKEDVAIPINPQGWKIPVKAR